MIRVVVVVVFSARGCVSLHLQISDTVPWGAPRMEQKWIAER